MVGKKKAPHYEGLVGLFLDSFNMNVSALRFLLDVGHLGHLFNGHSCYVNDCPVTDGRVIPRWAGVAVHDYFFHDLSFRPF